MTETLGVGNKIACAKTNILGKPVLPAAKTILLIPEVPPLVAGSILEPDTRDEGPKEIPLKPGPLVIKGVMLIMPDTLLPTLTTVGPGGGDHSPITIVMD